MTDFRVGVSRDFLTPDGTYDYNDLGLQVLEDAPGVHWEWLAERSPELRPDQLSDIDGLLLLGARVTAASLEGSQRLRIIARFGVGYDTVDVDACTRNGIVLTNTPDAVRRPVATAALTLLLSLSLRLRAKDQITRAGQWAERLAYMGTGLAGRTLGVVGLGNIGLEIFRLAAPFEMRFVGADPYANAESLAPLNIELMDLPELCSTADFVVIACALTPETRGLFSADCIARMKPTSFLVNIARGPIVDQAALTEALQNQRIQGAGLDVFEKEPIDPDDPLLKLDNVLVAPHALCWTDQMFSGMGGDACHSIVDVARGRAPKHVVNREVLDQLSL